MIKKPIPQTDDGFLTGPQLEERWGVTAMTLWRMRRDKRLRAYKFGERLLRYSKQEVLRIEQKASE